METVDRKELLKRAKQHAVYEELSDVLAGITIIFVLLIVGACLFGIAYMISLGWHMGMG